MKLIMQLCLLLPQKPAVVHILLYLIFPARLICNIQKGNFLVTILGLVLFITMVTASQIRVHHRCISIHLDGEQQISRRECFQLQVIPKAGNTKEGSITVPLTSFFTGLDQSVLQIKTKIVSCHTADSKPVKQEVNGTVILPHLVFPAQGVKTKFNQPPSILFENSKNVLFHCLKTTQSLCQTLLSIQRAALKR